MAWQWPWLQPDGRRSRQQPSGKRSPEAAASSLLSLPGFSLCRACRTHTWPKTGLRWSDSQPWRAPATAGGVRAPGAAGMVSPRSQGEASSPQKAPPAPTSGTCSRARRRSALALTWGAPPLWGGGAGVPALATPQGDGPQQTLSSF